MIFGGFIPCVVITETFPAKLWLDLSSQFEAVILASIFCNSLLNCFLTKLEFSIGIMLCRVINMEYTKYHLLIGMDEILKRLIFSPSKILINMITKVVIKFFFLVVVKTMVV